MIKVVQLDVKSSTPMLANLGMIPIPKDAFAEGRISKPELIAGAVQQLLTNLKIKTRQVAASISGYEVMIKKIDLPTMSEEDLDNRMQTELGQYIPYNIEEVGVDYQILGMSKDRASHMEVLLVAAKKESINDFLGLLKLCGLDAAIVDVDFFALGNAFEAARGAEPESVALIDI
ncbi:MAG: type IV pilus biogenesis protein PilM, partial [Acidobacteriota bacterium]